MTSRGIHPLELKGVRDALRSYELAPPELRGARLQHLRAELGRNELLLDPLLAQRVYVQLELPLQGRAEAIDRIVAIEFAPVSAPPGAAPSASRGHRCAKDNPALGLRTGDVLVAVRRADAGASTLLGSRGSSTPIEDLRSLAGVQGPLVVSLAFERYARPKDEDELRARSDADVRAAAPSGIGRVVVDAAPLMQLDIGRVVRRYCEAASDVSLVQEAVREWRQEARAFALPDDAGDESRLAATAARMWLFDREEALACIEALLESAAGDADLASVVGAMLLAHVDVSSDGRALGFRCGLAANLMRGIEVLSDFIAVTLQRVDSSGGTGASVAGSESRFPSATELLHLSCAVAHRQRIARILLLIFSRWQISADPCGNQAFVDRVPLLPGGRGPHFRDVLARSRLFLANGELLRARFGGLDASFCGATAALGLARRGRFGELSQLIDLLRTQSDVLWSSPDHSDGNPLFALSYSLFLVLAQALDYENPRDDADSIFVNGGQPAQHRFGRHLAALAVGQGGEFREVQDEWDHGKWRHKGFFALFLLASSHWLHSMFRVLPVDVLQLSEVPSVDSCPLTLPLTDVFEVMQLQPHAVRERLRGLVERALAAPGKALHMLSRIIASPSFAQTPSEMREHAVKLIHHVTSELVRLASSSKQFQIAPLLFRTRAEDLAAQRADDSVPSLAHIADSVEDLVILQAQIARACPPLACRFWCLRGSALDPYVRVSGGSGGDVGGGGAVEDADDFGGASLRDHESGLLPTDDGLGIGVKAFDFPGGRRLDPTAYLRSVALLLRRDVESACLGARAPHAPHSARFTGGDNNFGAEMSAIDAVSEFDLVTGGGDVVGRSDAAHSHRVKRAAAKGFLALFADLLAALGSGPLCADGRSCSESLANFLGRAEQTVLSSVSAAYAGSASDAAFGLDERLDDWSEPLGRTPDAPSFLLFPRGIVQYVSLVASELSPVDQSGRMQRYERLHSEWSRSRSAHEGNVLSRWMAVDVAVEPVQPESRRPSGKILQAVLRVVQALCLDTSVRDELCGSRVELPPRVEDGRNPERPNPELYPSGIYVAAGAAPPGTVSRGGAGGLDSFGVDTGTITSIVPELLALLPLGQGVGVRSKAEVLLALTRVVEGSPLYATEVRDGVESVQLLRTLAAHGQDIREELELTSSSEMAYDVVLAFCDLLRALVAQVPMHAIGSERRAPGILPHIRFVVEDILLQHSRRPVRTGCEADRWKMAFAPLAVLLEVLQGYSVHFPASGEAVAAVDVARRSPQARLAAMDHEPLLPDAPQTIPRKPANQRLKGAGWVLYAAQFVGQSHSYSPTHVFAELKRYLENTLVRARVATLSEVCGFLATVPSVQRGGGRFRAWTSCDRAPYSQLTYYCSADHPPARAVPDAPTTSSTIWFLYFVEDEPFALENWNVLVEFPVKVSAINAASAQGFVAGDPHFDFCASLPRLPISNGGGRGSAESTVEAPRSAAFDVMRRLLSGGDLFRCVMSIIAQADCDGPGRADGAAGLEGALERRDVASLESIASRFAELCRETSDVRERARRDTVFRRMEPDAALNERTVPEDLCEAAERVSDELAAPEIFSGMRGAPSSCENVAEWREKALCAALALLDTALEHDHDFCLGVRNTPLMLPDSLSPLPALIISVPITPFLLRAVAYRHDPRIGVVAASVLLRALVERTDADLAPGRLAAELVASGADGSSTGMTCESIVEALAEHCITDLGTSWLDERNFANERRRTQILADPLLRACDEGLRGVALRLLARGANAEARGQDALSPLMLACAHDDRLEDVASVLVERGGLGVHAHDCAGNSTLHHALLGGLGAIAARLLALGADVDGRNAELCSPLHVALSAGNSNRSKPLVALLLRHAARRPGARDAAAGVDEHLSRRNASGDSARDLLEQFWPNWSAEFELPDHDQRARPLARLLRPAPSSPEELRAPEYSIAGVRIPVSRLDGVFSQRCTQGIGWASNTASERSWNLSAASKRRFLVLSLIRHSLSSAPSGSLTLGHVLLGVSADNRARGSPFSIASFTRGGFAAEPAPLTCLTAILRSLADVDFIERRQPRVAEAELRIVLALMRDSSTAVPLSRVLADAMRLAHPTQEPGVLEWAAGHRVLIDGDCAEVLGPRDTHRSFRVRFEATGALRRVREEDLHPDPESVTGAFGDCFFSWLLGNLPVNIGDDDDFAPGDDVSLILQPHPLTGADAFFGSGARIEDALAFRSAHACIMMCAASEIHLVASARSAAGAPPTAAQVRELRALCFPLLSRVPNARAGEDSFVARVLLELGAAMREAEPTLGDESSEPLPRFINSMTQELIALGLDGAVPNDAGFSVGANGVRRSALVEPVRVGSSTFPTFSVGLLSRLLLSRAARLRVHQAHSEEEAVLQTTVFVQCALRWALRWNAFVHRRSAVLAQTRAYTTLFQAVLHHVLPDADPAERDRSGDVARQEELLRHLVAHLGLVLDALGADAGGAASGRLAAPASMLAPLAELALSFLHKFRAAFPSVRGPPQEIAALVRRVALFVADLEAQRDDAAAPFAPAAVSLADDVSGAATRDDVDARLRLRALLYACVVELAHFSLGSQPLFDFALDGSRLNSTPEAVAKFKRLDSARRDECARAFSVALHEVGPTLVRAAARDACGISAPWRPVAFLALTALLQPPRSLAGMTSGGAPHARWLAAGGGSGGAGDTLGTHAATAVAAAQLDLLRSLHQSGGLRALLAALCTADASEARSGAPAVPDAVPVSAALSSSSLSAVYVVRTTVEPMRGVRQLSIDFVDGAVEESVGAMPIGADGVQEAAVQLAATTYDAALGAIVATSLASDSGAVLLRQCGLVNAIQQLSWPMRCIDQLRELRAQALGLHGSSSLDGVVASAVASAAPRLLEILHLFSVLLLAHPEDIALATDIAAWLGRHYVLLDLATQACLAFTTHLACLRIMRAFVDLLRRLAAAPRVLDELVIVGAPSPDDIVLRIFQRFASQPRSKRVLQAAAEAQDRARALALQQQVLVRQINAVAVVEGVAPPAERVSPPAVSHSWLQGVSPLLPEERAWAASPLPSASALYVDALVTNNFHVHALVCGEQLSCAVAAYCRVRSAASFSGRIGAALPLHEHAFADGRLELRPAAGLPLPSHPAPTLFCAPEQVLGSSLALATVPTVKALVEAIEHAGYAFAHAEAACEVAAARVPVAGGFAVGVPQLAADSVAGQVALESARLALETFENLLTCLLAHAVADPSLRFRHERDVEQFQRLVSAAVDASPFSALVLTRLRELSRA